MWWPQPFSRLEFDDHEIVHDLIGAVRADHFAAIVYSEWHFGLPNKTEMLQLDLQRTPIKHLVEIAR